MGKNTFQDNVTINGTLIATGNVTFDTNTLFVDTVNNRVGIGTASPLMPLHIELAPNTSNAVGFYLSKGSGGFFAGNGTSNAANFAPNFVGVANYDESGLVFQGNLFNTTTTKAAILFQSYNASGSAGISAGQVIIGIQNATTRYLNMYSNGNVVLQSGGAFTDAGFRLDVNGTARFQSDVLIKGSGTGFSTALTITDSADVNLVRFNHNGRITLGSNAAPPYISTGTSRIITFYNQVGNGAVTNGAYYFTGDNYIHTTGNAVGVGIAQAVTPTSGTANFAILQVSPTVNQTGGANGITRGLYINTTLTAAADWRSIETSNNTGYAAYFAGTADLFFNDATDLQFGTTTGTKIGTATSQKLSLWNAAPDVQPTTAITAAAFVANTSGIVDDTATFGGYTMGQVVAALQRLGALA